VRTLIDTNVLVYAADPKEPEKRRVAKRVLSGLLNGNEAVFSTQVLQEYFSSLTRKLGFSADVARGQVEVLAQMEVIGVDAEMVLAAIDLCRLRKVSIWDALIIRAAIAGGCTRLLTEDLNHGETFDGVKVENPFR
jgi:predicted nucleic acid-binding protein